MDERSKLRADFEQLQREYKNMEAMRKAYAEESLGIIRKQREMVEKLQQDNDALKSEIELESRYAQRRSIPDDVFQALQDEIDKYGAKTDVERRNTEQLTKQIDALKQRILEQRKDMHGVNAAKDNLAMVNKQIRILENRLDKALVKFNEALSLNKDLRKNIDSLRQERSTFDGIYRKMEKQLQDRKKAMSSIIEASNKAYEARDAAQMEVAAIQQAMSREKQEFEEAIVTLNRQIDANILAAHDGERTKAGAVLSAEEESRLRANLSRVQAALSRDKATVQTNKTRVGEYEEGFSKIRAATGIASIEDLVDAFTKNEDVNFSLFNFVAEQSNEVERLEDTLAQLKSEEGRLGAEAGDGGATSHQVVKELEVKIAAADNAAQKYEARYAEASKTIEALKGSIQTLFARIGCNEKSMSEILSDSTVTENNMMQFLGVIEQRTNEIIQSLATLTQSTAPAIVPPTAARVFASKRGISPVPSDSLSNGAALVSLLGHGPATQHGSDVMAAVDPPKVDDASSDDNDSDDGITRPLTVDELKARTIRTAGHKHPKRR